MNIANILPEAWSAVEAAAPALALAIITYLTFWFRSHVGKSNGHGPLNTQTENIIKRLEELDAKIAAKHDTDNP